MRSRRAVSLIEVLVAAVLLAVGIGATLSALTAAARLRERASLRERVARVVADRLARFVADGCVASDTSLAMTVGPIDERWSITRSADRARLSGRAVGALPGGIVRLRLEQERGCP